MPIGHCGRVYCIVAWCGVISSWKVACQSMHAECASSTWPGVRMLVPAGITICGCAAWSGSCTHEHPLYCCPSLAANAACKLCTCTECANPLVVVAG